MPQSIGWTEGSIIVGILALTFGFVSKLLLGAKKNGAAPLDKQIDRLMVLIEKLADQQSSAIAQQTQTAAALERFALNVAHQFELNRQTYSPDDFKLMTQRVSELHHKEFGAGSAT